MKIERVKTAPVLIIGGRTYATFKQVYNEKHDVCSMCDLIEKCMSVDCPCLLDVLCDNNEETDEWFLKEVIPTRKDTVFDIAFKQNKFKACDVLCSEERDIELLTP